MKNVTRPKIPALIVSRIAALREDLNCNVIAPYENRRLGGSEFDDIVCDIHAKMPRVPYSTLLKSIQPLAGMLITPDVNFELSWRLAGNQHYLRKGIVVPIHTKQLFSEWVAVQVWDVQRMIRPTWLGDKKDGNKVLTEKVELDLFVMSGTPAGKRFKQTWPRNSFFRRESTTTLGFSSYDKRLYNRYFAGDNNYPLRDVRQLVKLRFFIYLDPVVSKAGEIFYEETVCTGSMRKWNRDIMKRRERQSFKCLKNYDPSTMPCYKCEVGFDMCRAGCHSVTYTQRHCAKCNQLAYFANSEAEWCVDCVAKTA